MLAIIQSDEGGQDLLNFHNSHVSKKRETEILAILRSIFDNTARLKSHHCKGSASILEKKNQAAPPFL